MTARLGGRDTLSQGLSSIPDPTTPQPVPRHRDAICAAAAAILAEEGMAGLTVSAVMARSAISRTAFYRVFDDIYAVVEAVLHPITAELVAASGDWFRGQTGSPEVVHGNLLSFARAYHPHGPTLEAISAGAALDPGLRATWDSFIDAFRDQTQAAITRDQHAGAIDTALDAHGAAQALSWMGEQTALRLMGSRQAGSPEDYADLLTPIWTRTLFGIPAC